MWGINTLPLFIQYCFIVNFKYEISGLSIQNMYIFFTEVSDICVENNEIGTLMVLKYPLKFKS